MTHCSTRHIGKALDPEVNLDVFFHARSVGKTYHRPQKGVWDICKACSKQHSIARVENRSIREVETTPDDIIGLEQRPVPRSTAVAKLVSIVAMVTVRVWLPARHVP